MVLSGPKISLEKKRKQLETCSQVHLRNNAIMANHFRPLNAVFLVLRAGLPALNAIHSDILEIGWKYATPRSVDAIGSANAIYRRDGDLFGI